MLFLAPTWQEMIATLPPGDQAEILAALAGREEDKRVDDTT